MLRTACLAAGLSLLLIAPGAPAQETDAGRAPTGTVTNAGDLLKEAAQGEGSRQTAIEDGTKHQGISARGGC